jgi:enoyl-CoA hydratase/carnithine racemase
MQSSPSSVPSFDTLQECADFLAVWFEDRAARMSVAQNRATAQMAAVKEWTAQLELLADHADSLGFVNECIPDAEDMVQQAKALATEEILETWAKITPTTLKTMTEGKIHNFTRTARMLDRLSATLTHRMESLRTIASAGKAMYQQEAYAPNIPGRKP